MGDSVASFVLDGLGAGFAAAEGLAGNHTQCSLTKHVKFTSAMPTCHQIGFFVRESRHVQIGPVLGPNSILWLPFSKRSGTAFCIWEFDAVHNQRGSLVNVISVPGKADVSVIIGRASQKEPTQVLLDRVPLTPLPTGKTDDEILRQRALEYFGMEDFTPMPPSFYLHVGAKSGCLSQAPGSSRVKCVKRARSDKWRVLMAAKEDDGRSDTRSFPLHQGRLPCVYIQNETTRQFLMVGGEDDSLLEAAERDVADTRFQWTLIARGSNRYVLRNNGTNRVFSCAGFGLPMRVSKPSDVKPGYAQTVRIEPV